MNIPEKLKLNRFKVVNIPNNRNFFQRFGKRVSPDNMYTGDDLGSPLGSRKMDDIADYEAYDRMMQEKEFGDARKDS